jgi:hypothetical protein
MSENHRQTLRHELVIELMLAKRWVN